MDKGMLNRKLEHPKARESFESRRHFFQLEVQILLALEDKDWSYEDLAKATGIHRQNIWRDLKNGGLHKASLDRISRYAEALGLHAHYFLMNQKQEREILPKLQRDLAYA
jgi:transcriptional regulator with XRE-family HTH domain